jgi:hypothetical protein
MNGKKLGGSRGYPSVNARSLEYSLGLGKTEELPLVFHCGLYGLPSLFASKARTVRNRHALPSSSIGRLKISSHHVKRRNSRRMVCS